MFASLAEMIAAAEAARDTYSAYMNARVKAGRAGVAFEGEVVDPNTEITQGRVRVMCSDGRANGRSRNKYRYNFKVDGKRATLAEAEAAF